MYEPLMSIQTMSPKYYVKTPVCLKINIFHSFSIGLEGLSGKAQIWLNCSDKVERMIVLQRNIYNLILMYNLIAANF